MRLTVHGDNLVVDEEQYQAWIAKEEVAQTAARVAAAWAQCRQHTPVVSILLPTYNSDAGFLREALDSVLAQLYPHWQLCIVDDASSAPHVRPLLQDYARRDSRIHLHFQAENLGIAATTQRALEAAAGDYIALLDHDDVLTPDALLSVAAGINENPQARLVYSDSDSLDAQGRRIEPFFKPGWNYDLLLGQNYLNHLTVYRRQTAIDAGGWRAGFEGSQDYDLLLRVVEGLQDTEILHIPAILYHWRQVPDSVSRANLGAAVRAARTAIREHLQRTGQAADVKPCTGAVLYNRIAWRRGTGAVAVAVYGQDPAAIDLTRQQLQRLDPELATSGVLLDGGTRDYYALNEWAAQQPAAILGFIAAGFVLESADVLSSLLGQVGRPEVAAVSAKLISARGRPRGPLLLNAQADGRVVAIAAYGAAHARQNTGYVAGLLLDRQVFALQAGCLFVQAASFRAAGGWGRPLADGVLAGIDLSLRLRTGDQRLVWNAQAPAISTCSASDAILEYAAVDVGALLPQYTAHDRPDKNANKNLTP